MDGPGGFVYTGWSGDPEFDDCVFEYIHKFSTGIPRLINLICGRLLLHGMVEELHRIEEPHVRVVIEALADEQLLPINRQNQNKQSVKHLWR